MFNYIAAGKPTRRYLALLCGLVTAFITASAQGQQPADAATAQKLDKVVVTGSSIRRIEGETALPILLITREDIKRFISNYITGKPYVAGMIINPTMNKNLNASDIFKPGL